MKPVPLETMRHIEAVKQNLLTMIAEHGWSGMGIYKEDGAIEFVYSVGIYKTIGAPEVVLYGLPYNKAHAVMWAYYKRLKDEGSPLPTGCPIAGLINLPVFAFEVSKRHYGSVLYANRWLYKGNGFPCLQIVFPDDAGRFPWSSGFNGKLMGEQRDLTKSGWISDLRS